MLQAKEKLMITLMRSADPSKVTSDVRKKIEKLVSEGNFIRPRIEGIMNIWFYVLDEEVPDLIIQLHERLDDAIFHPYEKEMMVTFDFLSAAVLLSPTYTYDWMLLQRRLFRFLTETGKFTPLTVEEFVETPLMRTFLYPELQKENLIAELYNYTNKMYDIKNGSDGRYLLIAPNGKTEFTLTKEGNLV